MGGGSIEALALERLAMRMGRPMPEAAPVLMRHVGQGQGRHRAYPGEGRGRHRAGTGLTRREQGQGNPEAYQESDGGRRRYHG